MEVERPRRRIFGKIGVFMVCAVAGMLFVAAAVASRGSDLRPGGDDLRSVVEDRARAVDSKQAQVSQLNGDIDQLTRSAPPTRRTTALRKRSGPLATIAGLESVSGPGVKVKLGAGSRSGQPEGTAANVLGVHEQDIRAFINALWSGGAEAISLQGRRIVATSSISSVGSLLLIDGVSYSPPYEIEAVGEINTLIYALSTSPQVRNYRRYAEKYRAGLSVDTSDDIALPAYRGSIGLSHARPLRPTIAGVDQE